MSQAEELLRSLPEEGMSAFSMGDGNDEGYIEIDADRRIIVPNPLKRLGVQNDHNIETVTIKCPRYWDGHDLSELDIFIPCVLPDGKDEVFIPDPLGPEDVAEYDPQYIYLAWTVINTLTTQSGSLKFSVCAISTDENGNEDLHWNSEPCSDCYISPGLNCRTESIVAEYPNIVADLLRRMRAAEEDSRNALPELREIKEDVERTVAAAGTDIDTFKNNAIKDIDNYVSNTIKPDLNDNVTTTLGYKNDASASKTEAVNAKAAAEAAKADALAYKNDASTSKEAAESAKTAAETARDNAINAKTAAETARNEAVAAKEAALGYKNDVESAKEQALTEINNHTRDTVKPDIVNYVTNTIKPTYIDPMINDANAAKAAAEAAKDEAVSAKDTAVEAKNEAVGAKDTAVNAKTAAETARDNAINAKTAAETARNEAVAAKGYKVLLAPDYVQESGVRTFVATNENTDNRVLFFDGSHPDLDMDTYICPEPINLDILSYGYARIEVVFLVMTNLEPPSNGTGALYGVLSHHFVGQVVCKPAQNRTTPVVVMDFENDTISQYSFLLTVTSDGYVKITDARSRDTSSTYLDTYTAIKLISIRQLYY